ncbi:MAG: ATP-binding protein, partial [Gallionellaceae bacterium]|nr:ATP-binding protein [Gallionellaceae bacterium]
DIEALKGTDSFAAIHPDDQARVRQVLRDTVATGRGQRTTFRFALPDGQVHEMESQGGVIRDESGAVTRVVVVSRDITERKHMEDEIRQLNAELEQRVKERTAELATANKELETFTYSVSHDLKAPLRGIDGYSRLLLEDHLDQLDEEGRLFLGNVRQGVDQMNGLIEDLLAYSRMERRNLRGATLNLARQVAGILAEKQDDLDAKGVVIKLDLAADTVCADPDGFNMVLRNLIDNAVKFSRDSQPPMIEIKSAAKPASAILSIKDNGIGFDMQFQERIFEIFQRLQRTEDYPGTGVGLAIVRKAMQRMGGRVWAESAPGQGATFFMELPR